MMLRPTYTITLGNAALSSQGLGPLVAIEVRCSKNGLADEVLISLGRVSDVTIQEGDAATVELGWDGNTELVFTGTVDTVESGIGRKQAGCVGTQTKLLRQRGDRSFTNQTAGQVVTALAGDAGVPVATIEDGIQLPLYLVDSSRAFYDHCLGLARRCGFDLYTTQEGKLVFARFAVASPDHTLRYGERILAASVERSVPLNSVTMVPESPASSAGSDTASWLVKDPAPHQGVAGAKAGLLLSDPVLRTKQAADAAAEGLLYFSKRDAVSGSVELMGAPEVRLGQAVELAGVPDAGLDGLYQVMGLCHRLDRGGGFRTSLTLGGMP